MPKKILLVDDEADFVDLISKRLEDSGYEVVTASDGVEGLQKAQNLKPDLIILDLLMPKMDGYEVCRLLKFDERYKNIAVIMLTAKAQEVDRGMAKKVRADDYLVKPFDSKVLLEKIKKLIEKQG